MAGMTQREYAAHKGVSQPAVSKALKTGRIKLESDGKIDPVKADAAWSRNTDPEKQANGKTGGAKTARTAQPRAPTPESTHAPTASRPTQAASHADESGGSSSAPLDYNRARTVRETFAARIEELKYRELSGQYVSRDAVKIGLFKVFTILKGSILGIHSAARLQSEIPPRTVELIDNLCRAALAEAHKSLEEIADGKL